jgi:bacterioferritin-associated ferredoxin
MFVCSCRAITEHQVVDAGHAGARTAEDLDRLLGQMRQCGGCTPLVEEILARIRGDALAGSAV